MPFPRKFLNDEEDILLDLHPHFWFLVGPVAALAVVIAGSVAAGVLTESQPNISVYGQLVLIGLAVLWLVVRYLKWVTTSFVVTTDRLITRTGVLAKHGREIPLERVNDIACHQSIFERIIGAGDLLIESGGEQGQQTITDVPRPFKVQNEIYGAIESAQDRDVRRAGTGATALSVPEQIEKLDELRQRGVISQAEFDAKKSQLLDRM
jgi:uncharacterized membrane protein YdbT with pleckstrin-like domain